MTDTTQPTPEQHQQVQEVTAAGVQAAQDAPTQEEGEKAAKEAMKKEAERVQADIPDDVIEKIAKVVSSRSQDELIQKLKDLGAFDPAPEPVQAPAQAPAPPGEQAQAQAPAPGAPAEAPRPQKNSFADRFLGL